MLFDLLVFVVTLAATVADPLCPCSDINLCKPVTKHYKKELVAFGGDTGWKKWNWTAITNIVALCDLNAADCQALYCFAHSRNVRFTRLVGVGVNDFPKLSNVTFRHQITKSWLGLVQNYSLDGINIDIEGAAFTVDVKNGITDLTNETYMALKSINPSYIVTWDIPYSPYLVGCLDGYCYDYVALSKCTDYMITMDYDATLDILIASANSPLNLLVESFNLYIQNLSISPSHLVMAVPWYGYDYTCRKFYNDTGDELCVILGSPSTQRNYKDIQKLVSQSIGGVRWDTRGASPYFTIKQNGVYHQLYYDNIKSLTLKYKLAISLGLRGIGMWTASSLDYVSDDPKVTLETSSMWNTLTEYVLMLQYAIGLPI